eukprot:31270-Pelagococcus_subviridis.AAC.8
MPSSGYLSAAYTFSSVATLVAPSRVLLNPFHAGAPLGTCASAAPGACFRYDVCEETAASRPFLPARDADATLPSRSSRTVATRSGSGGCDRASSGSRCALARTHARTSSRRSSRSRAILEMGMRRRPRASAFSRIATCGGGLGGGVGVEWGRSSSVRGGDGRMDRSNRARGRRLGFRRRERDAVRTGRAERGAARGIRRAGTRARLVSRELRRQRLEFREEFLPVLLLLLVVVRGRARRRGAARRRPRNRRRRELMTCRPNRASTARRGGARARGRARDPRARVSKRGRVERAGRERRGRHRERGAVSNERRASRVGALLFGAFWGAK